MSEDRGEVHGTRAQVVVMPRRGERALMSHARPTAGARPHPPEARPARALPDRRPATVPPATPPRPRHGEEPSAATRGRARLPL